MMRFLLVVSLLMLLVGCEDQGGSSNSTPAPPATPTRDPQWAQCMDTTAFDSGNPNRPAITLRGARVVNHPLGAAYVDAVATVTDPAEGDLTSRLTVTGLEALHTEQVGDYMIRYNVTNSAHLEAMEQVRIVRVNAGKFTVQTAREMGSTKAHMGYYEHLPVDYDDAAKQTFPLIVFQHGWGGGRFGDDGLFKTPLSVLLNVDMVKLMHDGLWDDARPFIVLSP